MLEVGQPRCGVVPWRYACLGAGRSVEREVWTMAKGVLAGAA